MPDLIIAKDIIQLGFAGFCILLLALLWWIMRTNAQERKELRQIMNHTQHDQMDTMKMVAKEISKASINQVKSNQEISRCLNDVNRTLLSNEHLNKNILGLVQKVDRRLGDK
jgi:type II secretory pathway component PulM